MIRIWNYNCDWISANIGVKNLAILRNDLADVLFIG